MGYIGDFALESTFDTKFCTVSTTGAPTTLAGTPVISAYVGNNITQLTAGITLTVDFDAVTGLHNVRVVATAANGYATASNYQLVITTGTVGGTSVVGYVVGEFSLEARSAVRPTVAARTLDVSATGEAGVDWANVGSPTTALALTGTTVATTQKVDVETIKTNPVVNAGTVTFPTTATLASTTNITAGTVTTTTNLTNLPAITANWLTATGIAADAITDAKVAADVTIASVTGAVGSVTGAVGSVTANVNAVLTNGAHGGAAATAAFGGAGGITSILTGSVTGSVGSVTGAVGSVTGAVGSVTGAVGSVTGAAGSVTGAVGSVTGNVGGNVTGSVGSVATGGIAAASLAAAAKQDIADFVLDRNMTTGTDSGTDTTAVRTARQALRVLRNKTTIAAGVATITKEDDLTASWTAAITTAAGNPISGVDPT